MRRDFTPPFNAKTRTRTLCISLYLLKVGGNRCERTRLYERIDAYSTRESLPFLMTCCCLNQLVDSFVLYYSYFVPVSLLMNAKPR